MEDGKSTPSNEAALAGAARQVCEALDAAPYGLAVVRLDGECVAVNRTLDGWARPAGLVGQLVGASLLSADEGKLASALAVYPPRGWPAAKTLRKAAIHLRRSTDE